MALVFTLNTVFDLHLNKYGLHPGETDRWYGILTFFWLHGSFEHLLNNSIALFVLLSLTRYYYPLHFFRVLLISIFLPALITFFIAREGTVHIGASGAVYSLAIFLFVSSLYRLNRNVIGLTLLVVFLYGGLWWGLVPVEERISYEGHLAGAITGFGLAVYYRKAPINVELLEPEPVLEEDIPDVIGDQWKTSYPVEIHYVYRDNNTIEETPIQQNQENTEK